MILFCMALKSNSITWKLKLMTILKAVIKGLYVIGDGSGVTHSLSHASASGIYVARHIAGQK